MVQSKGEEIEIKEEPSVPPEIFEAASSGKLVLFIGAGVSRIIGCPSWKKFALQQLKDLREKKTINYHEYHNLISFLPVDDLLIKNSIISYSSNPYPTKSTV